MPRKRQTTVGRLNPVDVRSKADIGGLENLIISGPLTLVLVYADWCGHCQTFKQNMWNEVSKMPNKTVNTASVHYDMVDKTSLKNAKIDGYPSLLLVGTDKKPATFENDGVENNAMPAPENKEELVKMVNTPMNSPVKNANSVAKTVLNNASANVNVKNAVTIATNGNNNIFTNTKTVNSYIPASADTIPVPDPSTDIAKPVLSEVETTGKKVGGGQRGGTGSLLGTLMHITQEAGHVGGLLLAATEYSDLAKRFTRRSKKRSKKTAKRKQRR
jgi:thiol-disulfide isomerase/thioredoxin